MKTKNPTENKVYYKKKNLGVGCENSNHLCFRFRTLLLGSIPKNLKNKNKFCNAKISLYYNDNSFLGHSQMTLDPFL